MFFFDFLGHSKQKKFFSKKFFFGHFWDLVIFFEKIFEKFFFVEKFFFRKIRGTRA